MWSLGAGLLGPILDGGRYRARTDQAEARAKQAEAAYRGVVRSAFRDVSDALSNLRYAKDTEADLVEHLRQSREALRLSRIRYERGYSPFLEVLDAHAHAERRAAALHPQPPELPLLHRGPDELVGRRLEADG